MKKLLSLGVVILFIGMTALTLSGAQDRSGNEGVKDRFVGAWRLAWLEEPDADGKVHKADCTGLLVYTRDGHMSVQVMYRNPQTGGQAALYNTRKAAMRPPLAPIRSTSTITPSSFTSRARWCAASSAKISREHSSFPAISSS